MRGDGGDTRSGAGRGGHYRRRGADRGDWRREDFPVSGGEEPPPAGNRDRTFAALLVALYIHYYSIPFFFSPRFQSFKIPTTPYEYTYYATLLCALASLAYSRVGFCCAACLPPYGKADVVRIRTGEVGAPAEKMAGGRSDMASSK